MGVGQNNATEFSSEQKLSLEERKFISLFGADYITQSRSLGSKLERPNETPCRELERKEELKTSLGLILSLNIKEVIFTYSTRYRSQPPGGKRYKRQ